MEYTSNDTAVVIIDPQNDVLSPTGKNWDSVGASVTENNTVQHLVDILAAAKATGFGVFISPHYFYPTDSTWLFNGPLESDEFRTHTFARSGALTLEGFAGSGADWLDEFKTYIDDGETIVVSPHKVWSPQSNDLILQLRKRGIAKIILCGMLANMCVESHLRDLLENGFEVSRRPRRHRRPTAPHPRGRLPGGTDQLRVSRPRRRHHGRGRDRHDQQRATEHCDVTAIRPPGA